MSIFNNFSVFLHNSAYMFKAFGWSIIPLVGSVNVLRAKSPALSTWRAYQSRIATDAEIDEWFLKKQHQALGIVLGAVSQLVVLDIDDPGRAKDFASQCLDLTDTFTVRSGNRELPHYYFHLPSDLYVTSRCKAGVELRSDGQYVVAPNMQIDGKHWTPINTRKPRSLTKRDLSRILAFMGVSNHSPMAKRAKQPSEPNLSTSNPKSETSEFKLSPAGLIRRYEKLASEIGRNNALFNLSCFARDCGWSKERVQSTLTKAHINHPPMQSHVIESASQRQREAMATITSVFNRPPRFKPAPTKINAEQLPNGVREKLLQLGFINVARVLDGLLMSDYESGQLLSASEVYASIGHLGIGRNTIYETLKAVVDGHAVFEAHVSPEPPSTHANAVRRFAEKTNQCLIDRVAKAGKIRGRKIQQYVMPSIDALCRWLNVNVTIGDTLPESALASPKAYREALHIALIKRAPAQYSRQWQSSRLGVSKDSVRRYEKARKVIVQAMYRMWQLGWHNLKNIVPDEPIDGHFVEDESGKRYPPIMALIRQLLARGRRLIYKIQAANFYMMPNTHSIEISHSQQLTNKQSTASPQPALSLTPLFSNVTIGDTSVSQAKPNTLQNSPKTQNTISETTVITREYVPSTNVTIGDILTTRCITSPDTEPLATRIYETLRSLNNDRAITRKNAQALIQKYSESLIERGLRVIKAKSDLRNPTGFLLTWLRAQNLQLNGAQKPPLDKLEAHQEYAKSRQSESTKNDSPDDWLNSIKESPYLKFIENADQVFGL